MELEEQMAVQQSETATKSETATTSASRNVQAGLQDAAQQPGKQDQAQPESKDVERQQRQDNRMARRYPLMSPFAMLQRILTDDIAGIFDRLDKPKASPRAADDLMTWTPKVDVFQRGNELVIRADLPGLNRDNVTVEVTDDAIVLSGERKEEHVEEGDNVYKFERTYGALYREIPLPEGAMVDQAKASFKEGVLEITVPAPPEQVSRGRRLEITK
jgi:HSP20 family protein